MQMGPFLDAFPPGGAGDRFLGSGMPVAHVRLLLLGLSLSAGMEFYTFDSMNLVLTDLTGTLGVSRDEASWLLTVYSSALFLGVPVSVWAAGYFGYKRYLIATVITFAFASAGCALSPTLMSMLICRAIQGLAGSGLIVWWRAAVYLLLPKPQRSASLMTVSTILYLSSGLGLLASGWITDNYQWRLIFVPAVLYAAVAVFLLVCYFPDVPRTAAQPPVRADWLGITLLAFALVSLQIILSRGEIDDWFGSLHIRRLGWICCGSLLLFIFWQITPLNRSPLLQVALLRERHVMASALIGLFTGIILSGSLYVLPEFLRNFSGQPHGATQAGRIICVYAFSAALLRPLMVGVVARLGQRKTVGIALAMLILSMLLFNRLLTTGTSDAYYIWPLLLYAACLSPLLPAVGGGTVARVEQNKLLDGVSLYMTFRQLGASLGVALLTILIAHRETLHSGRLYEHLRSGDAGMQSWLAGVRDVLVARGGVTMNEANLMGVKLLSEAGARQAVILSYGDAFAFMAVVGGMALCLVPLMAPTTTDTKK
jgi:MFS transporter, DHA2 family, multidrug resistance protein